MTARTMLTSFGRLWVFSTAVHALMQPYLAPHPWWNYFQLPVLVAAFVVPTRATLASACLLYTSPSPRDS